MTKPHTASIQLSGLSLMDIQELRGNSKFQNNLHIKMHIRSSNRFGLRVRTMDSALYNVTLTFLGGGLSGVVFNLLSCWIYDKYKQNRVKKPMINGVEVDIDNITPEEILAIFTKDKHIDPSEDDPKE